MNSLGQPLGPQGSEDTTNIPHWLVAFMRNQQETNTRLEQGIAQLQAATTPDTATISTDSPARTTEPTEDNKKPRHSLPHPDKFTGEEESDFPQFRGLLEAKLRIDRRAIRTEEEYVWYAYGRLAGTAAGRIYLQHEDRSRTLLTALKAPAITEHKSELLVEITSNEGMTLFVKFDENGVSLHGAEMPKDTKLVLAFEWVPANSALAAVTSSNLSYRYFDFNYDAKVSHGSATRTPTGAEISGDSDSLSLTLAQAS